MMLVDKNKKILDEIKNSKYQQSIKKFLKTMFIFEIGRRKGQVYKNEYESTMERYLTDYTPEERDVD